MEAKTQMGISLVRNLEIKWLLDSPFAKRDACKDIRYQAQKDTLNLPARASARRILFLCCLHTSKGSPEGINKRIGAACIYYLK